MLETSARLLRLLSLLQTPRDWTGAELAERLSVSTRTVRNDVGRLPYGSEGWGFESLRARKIGRPLACRFA
jgi:biotin operon repressor